MKNYKLGLLSLFALMFSLEACIEHEVIPAPVPKVELACNFSGIIKSTPLELTENVSGYTGKPDKALQLVSAPAVSSAIYIFEMYSATSMQSIKIKLGSVLWNGSVSAIPDLTSFNSFYKTNIAPPYSDGAGNGFEVSYRDGNGVTWVSKQNSLNAQNVAFSGINQESDAFGDYSKFVCKFNCYVYAQNGQKDSIQITNGVLKGWFKRQ